MRGGLGSIAEQRERMRALDTVRLERRLTGPEQAESDRLTQALYMREYRKRNVERFGHWEGPRGLRSAAVRHG